MKKKPEERLGHNGAEEIKAHPFLAGIDWDRVARKEMRPIFVPDARRANFSAIFEAEDILMEDNPLKRSSRKKAIKGSAAGQTPRSPDELLIETGFRDFDYQHRGAKDEEELLKGAQAVEDTRGEFDSQTGTQDDGADLGLSDSIGGLVSGATSKASMGTEPEAHAGNKEGDSTSDENPQQSDHQEQPDRGPSQSNHPAGDH